MTQELIGGVKLQRFAQFVVKHADEFPECLPLLRDAFQALSIAEHKLQLLKDCFVKHYDNRKNLDVSVDLSDNHDVSDYLTEAEGDSLSRGVRPVEKHETDVHSSYTHEPGQSLCELHDIGYGDRQKSSKKSKKKDRSEKKRDKAISLKVENSSGEREPADCELSTDSKESKADVKNEINVSNSFVLKRTNSEASMSSSCSDRKRRKSVSLDSNPSALPQLMQLNVIEPNLYVKENTCKTEPNHNVNNVNPHPTRTPKVFPKPLASLMDPGKLADCDTSQNDQPIEQNDSKHILRFSVSRNVDTRNRLNETYIIASIKKDPVMRVPWISVESMKRVGNWITGFIIFPDSLSCLRVLNKGMTLYGFAVKLERMDAVDYHGSFAEDKCDTPLSYPHHEIHSQSRSNTPAPSQNPLPSHEQVLNKSSTPCRQSQERHSAPPRRESDRQPLTPHRLQRDNPANLHRLRSTTQPSQRRLYDDRRPPRGGNFRGRGRGRGAWRHHRGRD